MKLSDLFKWLGVAGVCSSCGKPEHGRAGLFDIVLCDMCEKENTRTVQVIDGLRQAQEAASELHRQAIKCSAVLSEIPVDHRGLTLDSPELAKFVTRAEAIGEAEAAFIGAKFVTVVGSHGTGKSSIAGAMLGTLVEMALDGNVIAKRLVSNAHWVSYMDLIRDRAKFPLGHGESPLVEMCYNASLLVLDDLGLDPLKTDGAVCHVIHKRKDEGLHTIVTTGLPPDSQRDASSGQVIVFGLDWYGGGMLRRLTDERATVIMCSNRK